MKADLRSWLAVSVGVVIAFAAIAIGHIGELIYLMDVHPGVAGWVQALGSIAAIICAYVIGERQAGHERRLEKQREAQAAHDRSERIAALVQAAAVDMADRMKRYLARSRAQKRVYKNRAPTVAAALDGVRSEDVPISVLRPFLRIRAEYAEIEAMLDRRAQWANPDFDLDLYREIRRPYLKSCGHYELMRARFQEIGIRLSGPHWDGDPEGPQPLDLSGLVGTDN